MLESLKPESVVKATGTVQYRPAGNENKVYTMYVYKTYTTSRLYLRTNSQPEPKEGVCGGGGEFYAGIILSIIGSSKRRA